MRIVSKLTRLAAPALLAACLLAPAAVGFAQAKNDTPELYEFAEQTLGGFFYDLAPEPLRKRGPYKLLWVQWIGIPIVVLVGWLIGLGLNRLSRAVVRPLVHRTLTRWDDAVVESMSAPFTFAWTLLAVYLLLPTLELRAPALATAHQILRASWVGFIFWVLARAIDVASRVLAATTLAPSSSARRALLPLAVRAGKIVVLALAIVALLSEAGYSVGSLLAGLGIGGLAVALAAQKTFEHWLGAFAIAVDQPFREGDFVRINGLMGTIEQIGMRSTRVRTLERTIVSIPNGKLAEMQPETFAPRDRMRLNLDLRLVYGTTSEQIREILSGVERVLRDQEKTRADTVSVILRELGVAAIVIEVAVFFDTLDANEFNEIRQDVLLSILSVIENAGTRLALPAQRVELVSSNGFGQSEFEPASGVTSRDSSLRP